MKIPVVQQCNGKINNLGYCEICHAVSQTTGGLCTQLYEIPNSAQPVEGEKDVYKKLDASDNKIKPLMLSWLSELFGYKDYPHSFKDQWITWNIWDGELTISFDLRQPEQQKLLSFIHPRFKGCPQYKTLKIVNENSFYLEIEKLGDIKYPNIASKKLVDKTKHKGNDGDTFYTYDWEVSLDDGTCIMYHNQKDIMDMKKYDFVYNATIQERFFVKYLKDNYKPKQGEGYQRSVATTDQSGNESREIKEFAEARNYEDFIYWLHIEKYEFDPESKMFRAAWDNYKMFTVKQLLHIYKEEYRMA